MIVFVSLYYSNPFFHINCFERSKCLKDMECIGQKVRIGAMAMEQDPSIVLINAIVATAQLHLKSQVPPNKLQESHLQFIR